MDNLTHSLVGVLVVKTGLERRVPYAVPAAIVAANGPDIDLIASLGGRWSYLTHHRGVSHSIIGVILISVVIASVFWLIERFAARRGKREPRNNLRGLLVLCLIAGATHPLLDWTNNYGVRPFLPFDGRWFYGDLVFVFDPWLWLVLGGAAFLITGGSRTRNIVWAILGALLTVLMVVGLNLSLPNKRVPVEFGTVALWFIGLLLVAVLYRFRGRLLNYRWLAAAALCFVPCYWLGLAVVRHRVATEVMPFVSREVAGDGKQLKQVALMPTFGDPWRWQGLAETDATVYRITYVPRYTPVLRTDIERFDGPNKLQTRLVAAASRDPRAQVFFGFARFPLAHVDTFCTDKTIVRFVDLRYTEPSTGGEPFSVDVPVNCLTLFGQPVPGVLSEGK
jgi:inner membrane protein